MDLDDLCGRFFDALVAHDHDAVEAMLAPGATITQNGTTMTWPEFEPVLAGITKVLGDHRYDDIRRVVGDRAVVEEHAVVAQQPDGRPVRLHACVVIRVDADARITSVDEYVDPTRLA